MIRAPATSPRIRLSSVVILALTVCASIADAQIPVRPRHPGTGTADAPAAPRPAGDDARPELVIQSIEFEGVGRTSSDRAAAVTGLAVGEAATPDRILAAAERLRQSGLFKSVRVHTKPGDAPGRLRVAFAVEEQSPHLRFGLGYEDYTGWYLIPVELNLDNVTGHGEALRLTTRFGYRTIGVGVTLRKPILPTRSFWETAARIEGQDRVYYLETTEAAHHLSRGGLAFTLGNRLPGHFGLESSLRLETVDVDSTASVYRDRPIFDQQQGDEIPFSSLPASIQEDVGNHAQTRLGLALIYDRRSGINLDSRGVWARLGGEAVFSDRENFAGGRFEVRGYAPLGRTVSFAARTQMMVVGPAAPFFERHYLGGFYTVRGYPSQSLSPPEGNRATAIASVEMRHAWIGPQRDPRLVALLFLDAGVGWDRGAPDLDTGAAGIGYGLRLRLPWIGRFGVDVGIPLSASPVNEAFHVNLGLGWTY